MPIGFTITGSVIRRDSTTVTSGGGGIRGVGACDRQPASPSPIVTAEPVVSRNSLEA